MATTSTSTLTTVEERLSALAGQAAQCTACPLHSGRTNSVFSDGNPHAKLMLIGEGPGQNEDEQGVPFVGRSGQLLTQILESVNIYRETDIYICNVVKCRPPNNRAPDKAEMKTCFNYLNQQINIIQPKMILLAGATAMKAVLPQNKLGITKVRGQWLDSPFTDAEGNVIKAMPIFHPSYLLRNPSRAENSPKWFMWQDMKEIRRALDALSA